MATRQIKATNYFSHDSNARNDERILRLRMKHNAAGYGVYFMILERLREERNYMSVKDYNIIAFDLRVDAALVKSVVEDFGLFVFTDDGKNFYSDSFKRRMGIKDTLQRQRSEGGKIGMQNRWEKRKSKATDAKSETPKDTDTPKEEPVIPKAAPVEQGQQTSNEAYLERFFSDDNRANIEVLLMNFGMKPEDMPTLRSLAGEVVNEWNMSEKRHTDYTDWSQHLIATMRIKNKERQPGKGKATKKKTEQPPAPADYQYSGGFGSKDV